jgi:hypothetical protein
VRGNDGRGEGGGRLVAIQSLSTIKKGISRFNFPIQLFLFEVSTTMLSIKKTLYALRA